MWSGERTQQTSGGQVVVAGGEGEGIALRSVETLREMCERQIWRMCHGRTCVTEVHYTKIYRVRGHADGLQRTLGVQARNNVTPISSVMVSP